MLLHLTVATSLKQLLGSNRLYDYQTSKPDCRNVSLLNAYADSYQFLDNVNNEAHRGVRSIEQQRNTTEKLLQGS